MTSSTCWKKRSMRERSNRSVAYSHWKTSPDGPSYVLMATSKRDVRGLTERNSTSHPVSWKPRTLSFWRSMPNWKIGLRLVSLGTPSRSTTFSNGAVSWSHDSDSVDIVRPSSSANGGSPDRSVRSTIMLIRQPTSRSSCGIRRLGEVVPITMSSWPDQRDRTTFTAAPTCPNTSGTFCGPCPATPIPWRCLRRQFS